MNQIINREIKNNKAGLLDYYRSRAEELVAETKRIFGDVQYKERASLVNRGIIETKNNLIKALEQTAKKESWSDKDLLDSILMITYTNYIVMIEARNDVWPYEYMTFARRIGELWEPFCQLPWEYPVNKNLSYIIPPLFREVREKLTKEIETFINSLKISEREKEELKIYYRKVWSLVTSGEIQLELDLHFAENGNKYVVDFKSGFSSNEKGNTNRLLLVASIYKILEENYSCLIFVRSVEESNNHYLQTLKKSGLWKTYCGKETYEQIGKFAQFDLASWVKENVLWEEDFDSKMYQHIKSNNLTKYLEW